MHYMMYNKTLKKLEGKAMYITRFIRKDGKKNEDYWYHTKEEAFAHMKLFSGDDSGLYKRIIVVDEKGKEYGEIK